MIQILRYPKLTFTKKKKNVNRLNVFSHMIEMLTFSRDADLSLTHPVLL